MGRKNIFNKKKPTETSKYLKSSKPLKNIQTIRTKRKSALREKIKKNLNDLLPTH